MRRGAPARWLAAGGLLLLGALAARRLPWEYVPRSTFPEITVELRLSQATAPSELARAWLAPVEAEVYALGRVTGVTGEVEPDGAVLRVRFSPGTDPARKAARLAFALDRLRSRLPDAALRVWPGAAAGGDLAAVLWLEGAAEPRTAEAVLEAFRTVRGVRDVEIRGGRREETRIEVRHEHGRAVPAIRREIARALAVERLGEAEGGGVRRSLWSGDGRLDLSALSIPDGGSAFPLSSLARLTVLETPVEEQVHLDGRPGRALYVWREPGASPLAVRREIERRRQALPPGVTARFLKDESAPLSRLLGRLGVGLLLALLAAGVFGGRSSGLHGALYLLAAAPLALAAAAVAYRLAGLSLDVITLPALALATGVALTGAGLRLAGDSGRASLAVPVAAALAVAAAVALASPANPLLTAPARAFALAVAAALSAVALLPVPSPGRRGRRKRGGGRLLATWRAGLRDPGTVALLAASAAYLLFALCGPALALRAATLAPEGGDLTLGLDLPEGTTLEETDGQVALVERALQSVEGVRGSWSSFAAGRARIEVRVDPAFRPPARLQILIARLRLALPNGAALSYTTGTIGGANQDLRPRTFGARLEDEATAGDSSYRMILRAADAEALRDGYAQVLETLRREKVRSERIHPAWGTPAVRLELAPHADVPPGRAAALAAALREQSTPSPAFRLPGPGDRRVIVIPPGATSDPDRVPQRADLLDRGLATVDGRPVAADLFRIAEQVTPRRLAREGGRFILPVTVDLTEPAKEGRRDRREALDRALARVALPAGGDLERPLLSPLALRREELSALALSGALALLWLAVAGIALDSLPGGLASLAPLVLGLAAATPAIWAEAGETGELTLVGLAASLAAALPVTVSLAAAALPAAPGSRRAASYRRLRQLAPGAVAAAAGLALLLAVPTLGADPTREAWVLPLSAAAAAGVTADLAALFLVPALLRATRRRREEPAEALARRSPPAWSAPGPPRLRVRNLTKVYRGGFRALSGVSFELEPGIVGLLGPNGAGKTTLLRLLVGLLDPSRGTLLYRGETVSRDNLAAYRRRLGFLPQEFNAYPGVTAEQFLDYWATARGLAAGEPRRREIERLLAAVGLAEHARRKVRDFSGGMRRRVGIAGALLGAPELLIVDEPTTGLDLESRNRFREILLAAAGARIVVLSTHIASDVEAVASRLLVLRQGRLVFDGRADQLVARARGRVFEAVVEDGELRPFAQRFQVTSRVRRLEGIWVRAVARSGQEPVGRLVEPTLEDAYLATLDLAPPGRSAEPPPASALPYLTLT